jgi:DNA-binding CsgD family transcriptional regulator
MPAHPHHASCDIDPVVTGLSETFLSLYMLGVRERETYSDILFQTLLANPHVLSTWTVWEPNAFDGKDELYRNTSGHDETGRFIHCWHRVHTQQELVPVIGYERPEKGSWYWIPKRQLTSCRLNPIHYRFGSLEVCIRSEITPLIHMGRFCGAVGIDLRVGKDEIPRPSHKLSGESVANTTTLFQSKLAVLSPREREVFHWLEMGKTNEEIGIILGISRHTVKNHLEKIFQKLGVNNRCEAVLSTKFTSTPQD